MTIIQVQEICKQSGQKEFHMIGEKTTLNCVWSDLSLGIFVVFGEEQDGFYNIKNFVPADGIVYELGHSDRAQNR